MVDAIPHTTGVRQSNVVNTRCHGDGDSQGRIAQLPVSMVRDVPRILLEELNGSLSGHGGLPMLLPVARVAQALPRVPSRARCLWRSGDF